MRKLNQEVLRKSLAVSPHRLIEHPGLCSVKLCEFGIHHDALAAHDENLARYFRR